jgi:ribosomal protein S18 acetylase RimI-like enzyme
MIIKRASPATQFCISDGAFAPYPIATRGKAPLRSAGDASAPRLSAVIVTYSSKTTCFLFAFLLSKLLNERENMDIRQAKKTDLDEITELESVCFPPLEAASRKAMEKRLEVFFGSFLVAEENGKIIGFINGCVTDDRVICDEMFKDISYHDPDGGYQTVFGLVVSPEHRGKGIAKELMKKLIEYTESCGKKGLILTCKEHLTDFYRSFGYENSGVSDSNHGGAVWYDMIVEF